MQDIRHINANMPRLFQDATFDSYKPANDTARDVLDYCSNYNGTTNLILLGNVGTGKTHLACAIINKILDNSNFICRYLPFYNMTDIKINHPDKYKKILECDILVIDEFGMQSTDYKMDTFFEIINERYNNGYPTILISNLDVATFKNMITEPIYSRLKSNVVVKVCSWADYRIGGAA